MREEEISVADVAASFQEAVVEVLVEKLVRAASEHNSKYAVLAGGVASNTRLRQELMRLGKQNGIEVLFPAPILCTDNAAMIGSAAYYRFVKGTYPDLTLNAKPNLSIGESV